MKRLFCSAQRRNQRTFAFFQKAKTPLGLSFVLSLALLMTGCKKDVSSTNDEQEIQSRANSSSAGESNGFGNYTGLLPGTVWELQQAKIATARYNNFDNAIADGYQNINVFVQEMGHHYLKASNLNGTFDYTKPEILVYSIEENERKKLVAVEYAVPKSLFPNPPAGFTGDDDEWADYEGVLWTLHAWIWEYNPAGVFNPTNPNVHSH